MDEVEMLNCVLNAEVAPYMETVIAENNLPSTIESRNDCQRQFFYKL